VSPELIRLEIVNASIYVDYFTANKDYVGNAASLQFQAKTEKDYEKIEVMNQRVPELGMNWISGYTSLVEY